MYFAENLQKSSPKRVKRKKNPRASEFRAYDKESNDERRKPKPKDPLSKRQDPVALVLPLSSGNYRKAINKAGIKKLISRDRILYGIGVLSCALTTNAM